MPMRIPSRSFGAQCFRHEHMLESNIFRNSDICPGSKPSKKYLTQGAYIHKSCALQAGGTEVSPAEDASPN